MTTEDGGKHKHKKERYLSDPSEPTPDAPAVPVDGPGNSPGGAWGAWGGSQHVLDFLSLDAVVIQSELK